MWGGEGKSLTKTRTQSESALTPVKTEGHLSHKPFLGQNYIPNYFQVINLACLKITVADIHAELFIDQLLKFHIFPFHICHGSSSLQKDIIGFTASTVASSSKFSTKQCYH